jgi:hypothetical protein
VGVVDRFSERDSAALEALAPAVGSLLAAARRAEEAVRLEGKVRAGRSRVEDQGPQSRV